MDTYSFEDAVAYFEEEQILERQAKDIIEQQRQRQQQDENLRCPFVDLKDCTPVQKDALDAYFQHAMAQQAAKIEGNGAETTQPSFPAEQEPALPWVQGAYPLSSKLNTVLDIRALQHKKEAFYDPNPYEIMHMVLRQVPLVNYNGVFYVRKGCVFQQITDEDLRALVFSIAEPVLASGRSSTLLRNVCGLLKDYYRIKVRQTTETPDRVFLPTVCTTWPDINCYPLCPRILSPHIYLFSITRIIRTVQFLTAFCWTFPGAMLLLSP